MNNSNDLKKIELLIKKYELEKKLEMYLGLLDKTAIQKVKYIMFRKKIEIGIIILIIIITYILNVNLNKELLEINTDYSNGYLMMIILLTCIGTVLMIASIRTTHVLNKIKMIRYKLEELKKDYE